MKICRICKSNEATALNSHLIPYSLIKKAINRPGFKERGFEAVYKMDSYGIAPVHFGQSISPEYREELTGIPPDNQIIDKTEDNFARDNIFCHACEYQLGLIEGEFMSNVYYKIENKRPANNIDSKGNEIFQLTNYQTRLTYIVAYSIFFRISIGDFAGCPLESKVEDNLRVKLNQILVPGLSIKVIRRMIAALDGSYFCYPVIAIYLDPEGTELESENYLIQNASRIPYCLWANRLVLQLYKKESHIKASTQRFYGLSQMFNFSEYYSNKSLEMNIGIVSNINRTILFENESKNLLENMVYHARRSFVIATQRFFGRKATQIERSNFVFNYFQLLRNTDVPGHEIFIKASEQTLNMKF